MCGALDGVASAEPIRPQRDDEVIEVLPALPGARAEERRLRRQLAERPRDPALAVTVARRYLEQARTAGDPRFAGMALAALLPWSDAQAPDPVLLTRATLQQYVHDFDASVATLRLLLARPGGERHAQAWLTLATVLRVQGRYADSDAACRSVGSAGASLHGSACLAENAGLQGQVGAARATFARLLAEPAATADTQSWLLTSLAELEERDGHPAAADEAYRTALRIEPDAYAATAYADFLIDQKRPAEALAVLKGQTRTDAVLLRLAIAGQRSGAATAGADIAEMRQRITLENQRPDAALLHGREQAMFALLVDRAPERALPLARGDVAHQREPLDLLVYARAAHAAGDRQAIADVAAVKKAMGLHDRRIDALR